MEGGRRGKGGEGERGRKGGEGGREGGERKGEWDRETAHHSHIHTRGVPLPQEDREVIWRTNGSHVKLAPSLALGLSQPGVPTLTNKFLLC